METRKLRPCPLGESGRQSWEITGAPCWAVVGSRWERARKALCAGPGTLVSVPETLPLVTNTIMVSSGTRKKGIPGSGLCSSASAPAWSGWFPALPTV